MAKLFEAQKSFTRAIESHRSGAQRPQSAVDSPRRCSWRADLLERKLNSPDEALTLYRCKRKTLAAQGQRLQRRDDSRREIRSNSAMRRGMPSSDCSGKATASRRDGRACDGATGGDGQAPRRKRKALLRRQYELIRQKLQAPSESTPRYTARRGRSAVTVDGAADKLLGLLEELSQLRPSDDALLRGTAKRCCSAK